eukprot:74681-Alexandrium_andersonii.AAC.1
MSASLVGSEMCIRDRHAGGKDQGCHGHPCARGPAPRRSGEPRTRRHPAVSYTHLTLPTICSV